MQATQDGAVTTVRVNYTADSEFNLFLTSDLHVDAVGCDRERLLSDLTEAKERGAKIMFFGDIFDAMQGRFDPRRSMDELRPEYRRADYYDFVVKDVARILKPFAENILLITPGNHETSVLKHANIGLIDRLVWMLNMECGTNILQGGYGGWVRFMFETGSKKARGGRMSVKLKYHHGSGGDAPVTRGVIHTNRQNVFIKGADIIVNGHNHNAYYVPIVSETISDAGKVMFVTQHHIRTPGYKNDYGDGTTGWAIERGMVPKPIGGAFVKMKVANGQKKGSPRGRNVVISVQPVIHAPEV